MSPGKYSGAYRDSKDRVRPITPKKRSKAKTGIPMKTKKKKASKPKIRTSKGTSYWPSFPEARAYALKHDLPMDRIIQYEKGWAIQKEKSGSYYDIKKGGWNSGGLSEAFDEYKRYIAISPHQRELDLTMREIIDNPTLSSGEKDLLYRNIRARSAFIPPGPAIDPPTRSFDSMGPELKHFWRKTADGPAAAKEANANATAKEWFGVMTLTVPSMEAPGKFVVYYRDHPEAMPPQVELDQARKNNQNVMMWNNKQWEWDYQGERWVHRSVVTPEPKERLIGEPGEVVVSPRNFHSIQISPRAVEEERFINAYRRAHNTTMGLSYGRVGRMSDRELAQGIRSLSDLAELSGR